MVTKTFFNATEKRSANVRRIIVIGLFMVVMLLLSGGSLASVAGAATAAGPSPASAGDSVYVSRYLPDIIGEAQGPGDMVFLIYKYLMGLVGIVAVGVIMYGGVLRTVSADPSKIRASNDYIKNALKGIVLLFGAQVLFNTINPNIIDIQRIQRALQPSERIVTGPLTWTELGEVGFGTSTQGMPSAITPGTGPFVSGPVSAAEARSILASVGITMYPECVPGGSTKGCISLEGVNEWTLNSMIAMAQTGIPMHITSVTEGQHAAGTYSHANGYKWDMTAIDPKYFADRPNQFEKIATRSDSSATYRDKVTGAECSLEIKVPHWDCSVRPDTTF